MNGRQDLVVSLILEGVRGILNTDHLLMGNNSRRDFDPVKEYPTGSIT